MSIKLAWSANTEPDIASYLVQQSLTASGVFATIGSVPHDQNNPAYWDPVRSRFYFLVPTDDITLWYRIISVDVFGSQSLPTPSFQANVAPPALSNTVKIDHNYGNFDALAYFSLSGTPVENAAIRVFKKSDFDQGNNQAPLAFTRTNSRGRWVDPVFLTTGYSYVIEFAKESAYGPDHVEIVV